MLQTDGAGVTSWMAVSAVSSLALSSLTADTTTNSIDSTNDADGVDAHIVVDDDGDAVEPLEFGDRQQCGHGAEREDIVDGNVTTPRLYFKTVRESFQLIRLLVDTRSFSDRFTVNSRYSRNDT